MGPARFHTIIATFSSTSSFAAAAGTSTPPRTVPLKNNSFIPSDSPALSTRSQAQRQPFPHSYSTPRPKAPSQPDFQIPNAKKPPQDMSKSKNKTGIDLSHVGSNTPPRTPSTSSEKSVNDPSEPGPSIHIAPSVNIQNE